ncbi:hypothetical protein BKA03_002016 [Demequina lutea]|uniref:Uncharacterized protein n=1 Tax=Demequina lutea TaxID=431489 RepID=A0A7Z0CKH6_9MICO|nr:hypothetical protein [Demequina lutea]
MTGCPCGSTESPEGSRSSASSPVIAGSTLVTPVYASLGRTALTMSVRAARASPSAVLGDSEATGGPCSREDNGTHSPTLQRAENLPALSYRAPERAAPRACAASTLLAATRC